MRIVYLLFCVLLILNTHAASKRVLSTLPSFTESMFFLGAGNLLVGVSKYCNYPPEAKKLPRYGTSFDISLERLIRDEIDTVLLAQVQGTKLETDLKKIGVRPIFVPYKKLADAEKMLSLFNEKFNLNQDKKITAFKKELNRALKPIVQKKRVLILIDEKFKAEKLVEVRAAGTQNYFNEIIDSLGAINIVRDTGYPVLSLEFLLKSKVDVIIRISEKRPSSYENWQLSAYKDKIRFISQDYAVVLGPRVIKLIGDIRDALK